jgi:hypothetical protein
VTGDPIERLSVPVNGHATLDPAAATPVGQDPSDPIDVVPRGLSVTDFPGTVTPGQVLAGFGIIAALVLLVVGQRRRRKG